MFDLVLSSDGIVTRQHKLLEYLSWITIYKMLIEVNKYDEELRQLEMVADAYNGQWDNGVARLT
jgi:hypothetical protein